MNKMMKRRWEQVIDLYNALGITPVISQKKPFSAGRIVALKMTEDDSFVANLRRCTPAETMAVASELYTILASRHSSEIINYLWKDYTASLQFGYRSLRDFLVDRTGDFTYPATETYYGKWIANDRFFEEHGYYDKVLA